jgi:ubiquinone/menaquinone biosynthesis C-methylase UbiE
MYMAADKTIISLDYLTINRTSWNALADIHVNSSFYDMEGFLEGNTSLKEIELDLMEDISGKELLHLQCHFGQDTLSLERLGALVTGVDFSDRAIGHAQTIASQLQSRAIFIQSDVYNLPQNLDKTFDIVYTSYGTIGWLPDIKKWAEIVARFLKPGGSFYFVEFHPAVWMFDNDFTQISYSYFNADPILEEEQGSYADRESDICRKSVTWNHGLAEVVQALIDSGLEIVTFKEYNFSPYNCLNGMVEVSPGRFIVEKLGNKMPLVYGLVARKKV